MKITWANLVISLNPEGKSDFPWCSFLWHHFFAPVFLEINLQTKRQSWAQAKGFSGHEENCKSLNASSAELEAEECLRPGDLGSSRLTANLLGSQTTGTSGNGLTPPAPLQGNYSNQENSSFPHVTNVSLLQGERGTAYTSPSVIVLAWSPDCLPAPSETKGDFYWPFIFKDLF